MGAGNLSGAVAMGTKGERGPRAQAKEAPGSAPGPRGPGGCPLKQPGVLTGGTLWKRHGIRKKSDEEETLVWFRWINLC